MALSFDSMIKQLRETFQPLPDFRRGKNRQYEVRDAAAGAFSVFFMQSPSFLAHQRDMQRKQGRNNAATLFGVERLLSDPQIRNLLDPIAPESLRAPYWAVYEHLQAEGHLRRHVSYGDTLLCAWTAPTIFHRRSSTVKTVRCIATVTNTTMPMPPSHPGLGGARSKRRDYFRTRVHRAAGWQRQTGL
jgi:hypothetical protein